MIVRLLAVLLVLVLRCILLQLTLQIRPRVGVLWRHGPGWHQKANRGRGVVLCEPKRLCNFICLWFDRRQEQLPAATVPHDAESAVRRGSTVAADCWWIKYSVLSGASKQWQDGTEGSRAFPQGDSRCGRQEGNLSGAAALFAALYLSLLLAASPLATRGAGCRAGVVQEIQQSPGAALIAVARACETIEDFWMNPGNDCRMGKAPAEGS